MSSDEEENNDGKARFEAERDKVLSEIPQALKDKFGTIGFCTVEDDDDETKVYYQPVLIVNPFEVPPKPVRDIYWMDMFTKAKRSKKKLAALDYLVYVYGSDDPDDCYNFVNQEEFVTLEDAKDKGLLEPPTGDDLTELERRIAKGLEEMKLDMEKPSQERKPHSKHAFLEVYEQKAAAANKEKKQQDEEPAAKKQKTN